MDITEKQNSGRNWHTNEQLSFDTVDNLSPDRLHIYSNTPDLFSEFKAISVIPGYSFNLTHFRKGTNSYQAGTVDKDFHPKDPWGSPNTNVTYYQFYQLNIPARGISFDIRLAMEGGEPYYPGDISEDIVIANTFSYFGGIFDSETVTGW